MASAENSLGRPDRALNLLNQAEKLEPRNTEVQGLRQQIQAGLRPELRIGWSYVRDNESLNTWRYQLLDFRFNLHPRLRNFVTVDMLPSSARADLFGYAVGTSSGLMFATRVPVDSAVPSPTLLTEADFPPELLVPGSARIRQSAFQFQFGGSMKMNRWFSWTATGGVMQLRHGDPDLSGFPSNRTRPIYSVAPSFQISRHWQLALGYGHRYLAYTPKAVAQTTQMEEFTADLVWMPNDRTRLAFGAYHRDLSPEFLLPNIPIPGGGTFASRIYRKRGNGGTVAATYTFWRSERAQFDLGYDGTVFGYSHPNQLPFPEYYLNPGVFAPSFYQRHAALVKLVVKPSKYFSWDMHGTAGPQQVKQGSDLSFSSTAGTKLEFPFSPHATLTLGYDYFNTASALQALIVPGRAAAYHSNNVTANLAFRF
jgi:hypothetical protein